MRFFQVSRICGYSFPIIWKINKIALWRKNKKLKSSDGFSSLLRHTINLGAQISLRKNEFLRIKKPQSIEDRDAWDCIQIMMLCLFEMEDTQALYALTWGEIFFLVFQSPTIENLPENLPRNRFSSSKGNGIQRISLASSLAQVRETRKYVRPSLWFSRWCYNMIAFAPSLNSPSRLVRWELSFSPFSTGGVPQTACLQACLSRPICFG